MSGLNSASKELMSVIMKITRLAVGFEEWGVNQTLSLRYIKNEMPVRHLGGDVR